MMKLIIPQIFSESLEAACSFYTKHFVITYYNWIKNTPGKQAFTKEDTAANRRSPTSKDEGDGPVRADYYDIELLDKYMPSGHAWTLPK